MPSLTTRRLHSFQPVQKTPTISMSLAGLEGQEYAHEDIRTRDTYRLVGVNFCGAASPHDGATTTG